MLKSNEKTEEEQRFADELSSGLVWDIIFHHYIRNFGWGIYYSGYHSDSYLKKTNTDHNFLLSYVAPLFCYKYSFNNKWMINGEVGIGYLKFSDKIITGTEKGKLYASTVGFNYSIGIEYMINEYIGIGVSFNEVAGFAYLKDIKMKNAYSKSAYNDNDTFNLSRINVLGGIRFYLGKK